MIDAALIFGGTVHKGVVHPSVAVRTQRGLVVATARCTMATLRRLLWLRLATLQLTGVRWSGLLFALNPDLACAAGLQQAVCCCKKVTALGWQQAGQHRANGKSSNGDRTAQQGGMRD
jgi:hypothetical protein